MLKTFGNPIIINALAMPHPYSCYGYAVAFEPHEYYSIDTETEGKLLVCGVKTSYIRMTHEYDASLANRPTALLVRKLSQKNQPSKKVFVLYLEPQYATTKYAYASREIENEFWEKYSKLACYAIYDLHQMDIAEENVKRFCGRGWSLGTLPSSVESWMNSNKYFCELYQQRQGTLEDARREAHNNILEMQEKWFKDEPIPALKPLLSTTTDATPSLTLAKSLRELDSIKQHIWDTPRIGLDFTDFEELRNKEKEIKRIIHANFEDLPKTSLGTLDYRAIRQSLNT